MKIQESVIWRASRVLSKSDRNKVRLVITVQVILGLLDLAGVAAIGMLGSLAVRGVSSQGAGLRVTKVLSFIGLEGASFQTQAAVLGITAAVLLVTRTVLSVITSRKTFRFLSNRGAHVSSGLITKVLSLPLIKVQEKTVQETIFTATRGVDSIVLGVLGIAVTMISDFSLLLIMVVGLLIVDPIIALSTSVVFLLVGFSLYKIMNTKARNLGRDEAYLTVQNNEKIAEVLNSYREAVVRNRRGAYAREIEITKHNLANTLAEIAFLPNISKYVIESTVIIGTLGISALQFLMQDASHAVATLSVFMAAATRIAPAVMRIQQGAIGIKQSLGAAVPTLKLIEELGNQLPKELDASKFDNTHSGFEGAIQVKELSLKYPNAETYALSDIKLDIKSGEFLAIVGPSGAGKTSLVDVLLGVVEPAKGEVRISGLSPLEAISKWPGALAYVPQDVFIANGSIRRNVALGFPEEENRDSVIRDSLEMAQLGDYLDSQANGIDTQVGERGSKMSGGQRQRLGIARALFTNPKVIILDEATSALDVMTEHEISDAILKLKGKVTVIMIAHRLSTVMHADKVIYMEQGRILAVGNFEDVRNQVPNFDKQALLLGL